MEASCQRTSQFHRSPQFSARSSDIIYCFQHGFHHQPVLCLRREKLQLWRRPSSSLPPLQPSDKAHVMRIRWPGNKMCTPLTRWILPPPGPRHIYIPTLCFTLEPKLGQPTDRPTNNLPKIWKKYHSVPSIALHKLRQLLHNGLGRVLRYLQGGGREGGKVISNFCNSTTLSKTVAFSPWLSIPSTTFSCKPRALELCFVIVLFLFWKL